MEEHQVLVTKIIARLQKEELMVVVQRSFFHIKGVKLLDK
jgi:hypothetical protein